MSVQKSERQQLVDMIDRNMKRVDELTLMLDVINSAIVTGPGMPEKNSPCHKKILELMERNGRKPTAESNNDK